MNHCDACGQDYEYSPKVHRCPGEWEAMLAEAGIAPITDRFAGMTWVEECMSKQRKEEVDDS